MYKPVRIGVIVVIALVALAGISGTAAGQSRQQAQQDPAAQQPADKATVESFAVALAEVKQIQSVYTEKIQSAKEPEVANILQREAQTEMVKAVQKKWLTVNQYNRLAQKMDADPEFRVQVESVINGK